MSSPDRSLHQHAISSIPPFNTTDLSQTQQYTERDGVRSPKSAQPNTPRSGDPVQDYFPSPSSPGLDNSGTFRDKKSMSLRSMSTVRANVNNTTGYTFLNGKLYHSHSPSRRVHDNVIVSNFSRAERFPPIKSATPGPGHYTGAAPSAFSPIAIDPDSKAFVEIGGVHTKEEYAQLVDNKETPIQGHYEKLVRAVVPDNRLGGTMRSLSRSLSTRSARPLTADSLGNSLFGLGETRETVRTEGELERSRSVRSTRYAKLEAGSLRQEVNEQRMAMSQLQIQSAEEIDKLKKQLANVRRENASLVQQQQDWMAFKELRVGTVQRQLQELILMANDLERHLNTVQEAAKSSSSSTQQIEDAYLRSRHVLVAVENLRAELQQSKLLPEEMSGVESPSAAPSTPLAQNSAALSQNVSSSTAPSARGLSEVTHRAPIDVQAALGSPKPGAVSPSSPGRNATAQERLRFLYQVYSLAPGYGGRKDMAPREFLRLLRDADVFLPENNPFSLSPAQAELSYTKVVKVLQAEYLKSDPNALNLPKNLTFDHWVVAVTDFACQYYGLEKDSSTTISTGGVYVSSKAFARFINTVLLPFESRIMQANVALPNLGSTLQSLDSPNTPRSPTMLPSITVYDQETASPLHSFRKGAPASPRAMPLSNSTLFNRSTVAVNGTTEEAMARFTEMFLQAEVLEFTASHKNALYGIFSMFSGPRRDSSATNISINVNSPSKLNPITPSNFIDVRGLTQFATEFKLAPALMSIPDIIDSAWQILRQGLANKPERTELPNALSLSFPEFVETLFFIGFLVTPQHFLTSPGAPPCKMLLMVSYLIWDCASRGAPFLTVTNDGKGGRLVRAAGAYVRDAELQLLSDEDKRKSSSVMEHFSVVKNTLASLD